eukprot:TRINITY_DN3701_c0_g1_i2.p2 TRINITY_DN3701_c0_g1~~TRINITY_DN3701_c0_g1_i2.p2  ORF type:complete len:195 (-),score=35.40 TRINITY_DN3701_c0_g1_i2:210-794(-)
MCIRDRIKGLVFMNGSDLKKYERKDCEIYYLRKTFEEYLQLVGKPHYDFDVDDCLAYCRKNHPRIAELIKMYGMPYEPDKKGEDKEGEKNVIPVVKKTMYTATLTAGAGPYVGQPPIAKKFPGSTRVSALKSVLSKLYEIRIDRITVMYRAMGSKEPYQELVEEHRLLIELGGEDMDILVDEKNQVILTCLLFV